MNPLSQSNSKPNANSIGIVILINFNCLLIWYKQMSILTYLSYLSLFFIITAFMLFKLKCTQSPYSPLNEYEYIARETIEEVIKSAFVKLEALKSFIDEIASLKNSALTIEFFVSLYSFIVISKYIPQIYIILLAINLLVLFLLFKPHYSSLIANAAAIRKKIRRKMEVFCEMIPKYKEKAQSEAASY